MGERKKVVGHFVTNKLNWRGFDICLVQIFLWWFLHGPQAGFAQVDISASSWELTKCSTFC